MSTTSYTLETREMPLIASRCSSAIGQLCKCTHRGWESARGWLFVIALLIGMSSVAGAAPSITSLSPTSGAAGASVTITGAGFGATQGGSTVKFNGTTAAIASWSNTTIVATVPTSATTGSVIVTVAGSASNGRTFTVLPAPTISLLSRTSGAVGASVTISGANFGATKGSSTVKFNGVTASTTSWSATTVVATVPSGATTGAVVVRAAGVDSNGVSFSVVPKANISSLSPNSGAAGALITVNGTNFGTAQGDGSVRFNGTLGTPTTWSDTMIRVPVPSGATTGNVVVRANGVNGNGRSFTVVASPIISSVSPTSGIVGTTVVITGANFGATKGSSTLLFNGVAATPASWSATSITTAVPAGAATGNVVVIVAGGSSNGVQFEVPVATGISISPQTASMPVGATRRFVATATYADSSTRDVTSAVVWSSTDPVIASIDATGRASALVQGLTTIHAGIDAVSASAPVSVTPSRLSPTGNLNTSRRNHTDTRLSDGKVLILAGQTGISTLLKTAELYDVTMGGFTNTGSLITPRTDYTATRLNNGKVLIAGGWSPTGVAYLSSAELYDPATATFSSTGSLNIARGHHSATLLENGMVLIAGGSDNTFSRQPTAELYDPSTGTFTTTGSMITPRASFTATPLGNGKILFVGGGGPGSTLLATAELYDTTAGTFTATGTLHTASRHHAAAELADGRVLIAGGYGASSQPLARAEVFDPDVGEFVVTGSLVTPRTSSTATLLTDGSVLIVAGYANSGVLATAERYDPSTGTFELAGSLNNPRNLHTSELLNDGRVLIVGGVANGGHSLASAEIYTPEGVSPPPQFLRITPGQVTMQIGETQRFTVVDESGHPRGDASWTISGDNAVTLTTDEGVLLTGVASGQATLTATIQGVSGAAPVTVQSQPLAPGTPRWSTPLEPSFTALQLTHAMPSSAGPKLYALQSSGAQVTTMRAYDGDGGQLWDRRLPAVNGQSVPDAFGGLLLTQHNTCEPGQTEPMRIVNIDGPTGQTIWEIVASPSPGGAPGSFIYCYPEAPRMAVRSDGNVFITAPGNTSGLPSLMKVGPLGATTPSPIPESSYTSFDGVVSQGYSPIGPPTIDLDSTTFVAYEVRVIAYPPRITSATLYLLRIASDNSTSTITVASTTADENLFPGRIIPDGEGGALVTWTVAPGGAPPPARPYRAVHVSAPGIVGTPYELPFGPGATSLYGRRPSLVLGPSGTVYATDGTSTSGPSVVSLDLQSGSVNWMHQVAANRRLSLLAITEGGGVTVDDSEQGVVQFDSAGQEQIVTGPLGGVPSYSWTGTWYVQGSQAVSELTQLAAVDPAIEWGNPGGNPSHNGAGVPLCPCLAQSLPTEALMAANEGPTRFRFSRGGRAVLTSLDSDGLKYVHLMGDPGLRGHNVGSLFIRSSETAAALLTANGHEVVAQRVSSVQDFNAGLVNNGLITGGVTFFGHAGQGYDFTVSMLAPGEQAGASTNISIFNVSQLSNQQLAPTASVTLKACNAGMRPYKDPTGNSIAQVIASQLNRGVYAWKVGLFFTNNPNQRFPGKKAPRGDQPVYMVPLGGTTVEPCGFRPDMPEPSNCGGGH
jgi:hypothetical protein